MAEATKQPTAADLIAALKAKADKWISEYSGKPNHNPHLRIAQVIKPLLDKLALKDAKVSEIAAEVAKVKDTPDVIDPNWKPEVPEKLIATPKNSGALNVQA